LPSLRVSMIVLLESAAPMLPAKDGADMRPLDCCDKLDSCE